MLAAASEVDIAVFKRMQLDLPDGTTIYADKPYTDYAWEDLLNEDTDLPLRKRAAPSFCCIYCKTTNQTLLAAKKKPPIIVK